MKTTLTVKQEAFCQAYIYLGDKSAAYREAYSTANMKPESINRKAFELFNNVKITSRVGVLQSEIKQRNNVTIDDIVSTLADMLQFDIADLYDGNGALKAIHQIPKKSRLMIAELGIDEIYSKNLIIGKSKKIKVFDKLSVVEKLMKHLGGYQKDNEQSASKVIINTSEERESRIAALIAKAQKSI